MKILLKLLMAMFVLTFLSGCLSLSNNEENEGKVDYFLLKSEAEKAYKNKDYKAAEKKYLKISKGVARDPEAWFKLGNIYARTQRPNYAVRAYKEAIVRDTKLTKAWNNMAVVYLRQALNAYTSMVTHAEPGDPLIEKAGIRLEKIYELIGENKLNKPKHDESSSQ